MDGELLEVRLTRKQVDDYIETLRGIERLANIKSIRDLASKLRISLDMTPKSTGPLPGGKHQIILSPAEAGLLETLQSLEED